MKKIILSIIILVFLTAGCSGLYNLSSFILPDDTGFLTMIEELDTPEKIGNYMVENFTYEMHDSTLTPYQLYKTNKGDCDDFAIFGIFIANYNGYETYHIAIILENGMGHYLAVYVEDNKYNYSNNLNYYPINVLTFKEIISHSFKHSIWSKYIVYDYDMNIVEIRYNN